jgi:predicted RNA-binding Zn-ribbon protein involved in translation (DUF1610 family)
MVSEKAEESEKAEKAEEMKDSLMKCTSCGVKIEAEDKWVKFSCPKCGKQKIIRCDKCKKLMNSYECGKCGFVGP